MAQTTMADKEICSDLLMSQKQTSSTLNTCIGESSCPNFSQNLKHILEEEHQIHADLFTAMNQRGWYPVKDAPDLDVQQAKNTYNAMQV
ncbi:MAG: spore coat protein [Peptococcaceae bacterium]|nr:spore coat protein [Peptococcaceae bacterium]MDR2736871.1 spore coat protein [Gracilibacteraceae bacterium]